MTTIWFILMGFGYMFAATGFVLLINDRIFQRKALRNVARTHDLVSLVRKYAIAIDNKRTIRDVNAHLVSEVKELDEEINGVGGGPDGIVGEAMDVALCALDLIIVQNPEMMDDEIMALATRKLEKWKRRYSNSIEGDRSID